jgi:hypothetical protein
LPREAEVGLVSVPNERIKGGRGENAAKEQLKLPGAKLMELLMEAIRKKNRRETDMEPCIPVSNERSFCSPSYDFYLGRAERFSQFVTLRDRELKAQAEASSPVNLPTRVPIP